MPWWLGAASIPLILLLALIAASSTALTGHHAVELAVEDPAVHRRRARAAHPATNLMTGVMSAEVASNASNLLMDIKPGYMLGAKPRQQAIGHVIGIVAGALAATPLFFLLFGLDRYVPGGAVSVQDTDGERQVCVSGRRAVEGRVGPRDDDLRRRLGTGTAHDVDHLVDGDRGDCGARHGDHARRARGTASRSRRSRSGLAWSCRPSRR